MEKVLRLFEGRAAAEGTLEQSFDEFDPQEASEETLRTLEDFVICDEYGNFVAIDELGEGRPARAVGYVVEPLPFGWRQNLLAFSSSMPTELIDGTGVVADNVLLSVLSCTCLSVQLSTYA